jgi:hypothetical protein
MWILTWPDFVGLVIAEGQLASDKIPRYVAAQVEDGNFIKIKYELAGLFFDARFFGHLLAGDLSGPLLAAGLLGFLLAAEGKPHQQQTR